MICNPGYLPRIFSLAEAPHMSQLIPAEWIEMRVTVRITLAQKGRMFHDDGFRTVGISLKRCGRA